MIKIDVRRWPDVVAVCGREYPVNGRDFLIVDGTDGVLVWDDAGCVVLTKIAGIGRELNGMPDIMEGLLTLDLPASGVCWRVL